MLMTSMPPFTVAHEQQEQDEVKDQLHEATATKGVSEAKISDLACQTQVLPGFVYIHKINNYRDPLLQRTHLLQDILEVLLGSPLLPRMTVGAMFFRDRLLNFLFSSRYRCKYKGRMFGFAALTWNPKESS